jgi:hypothetical protein
MVWMSFLIGSLYNQIYSTQQKICMYFCFKPFLGYWSFWFKYALFINVTLNLVWESTLLLLLSSDEYHYWSQGETKAQAIYIALITRGINTGMSKKRCLGISCKHENLLTSSAFSTKVIVSDFCLFYCWVSYVYMPSKKTMVKNEYKSKA